LTCVEWSDANLDRLSRALRELGAELAISARETVPVPIIDARLLSQMKIGTWQTNAGGFDVLKGIPKSKTAQAEFRELGARAVTVEVQGRKIRIADLADVVRSKRIADRPKDREGLPELEQLLKTAPDDLSDDARLRRAAFPSPPPGRYRRSPGSDPPSRSSQRSHHRRTGPGR